MRARAIRSCGKATTRLATIVQACERSLRLNQDSKLYQRLRRNKTYG